MEKIFVVGKKKYDKTSRQFRIFYEDGALATGSTTATTVFSVPSNKTFYLRNIVINNTATTGNVVTIRDADSPKMSVTVSASSSKEITNIKGISFVSGVTAVCSNNYAIISVGGEVTEV